MNRPYAEVIGDPISHSKSPRIHNFWLKSLGIDADYRACQVPSGGLADYFAQRQTDENWRGCNVTLPHKLDVMNFVADPGDIRGTIGAMNTIARNEDCQIFGTNTDAAGFASPILDIGFEGSPVVVIGTGGAAHAILFALAQAKVGTITLLARNPLKGAALLARFGLKGEVKPLNSRLPAAALLVNASPMGMKGQEALELDLGPLPNDAIVYDIVYEPMETRLLEAAAARGLATIGGLEMLIGQAAVAFELFFGVAPPQGEEEALRTLLFQ